MLYRAFHVKAALAALLSSWLRNQSSQSRPRQGMQRIVNRRATFAITVLCLFFGWAVLSGLVTFERPLTFTIQYVNNNWANGGGVCEVPLLDPFDPEIRPLLSRHDVSCHSVDKQVKFDLNGSLIQKDPRLKCAYKCVRRKNDYENDEDSAPWQKLSSGRLTAPDCDVVKTKCSAIVGSTTDYDMYPNQVVRRTVFNSGVSSPSVLLLMIDGVSNSAFSRDLPQTVRYFTETMGGYRFQKHFKMDINTFPNMMAVLTGKRVWTHGDQISDLGVNRTNFHKITLDSWPFVWKNFAQNGYATSYFEDFADYATFQYSAGGFVDPPTDHYYRPYVIARRMNPYVNCVDGQFVLNKTITVPQALLRKYANQRIFALNIFGLPSHNSLDQVHLLDPIFLSFLRQSFESGALNQTAVFLFSDHGARVGSVRSTTVGFMEEQMPFLGTYFPEEFLQKFPQFRENLKSNVARLTSQFDLHATLLHLLNLSLPSVATHGGRGLSLLSALPENRTCAAAGIPNNVCLCNKRAVLPLDDAEARGLARAMLNRINTKVSSLKYCEVHRLLKVISAYRDAGLTRLTFESVAANALFEVFLDNTGNPVSRIERINAYERTAKCLTSSALRPYCICKKSPPPS